MRLLSFDTSGELNLCLMENDQVVQAKVNLGNESRQAIASSLLPSIDQALNEAGWQKGAIDALVVGIGPGSFTGIRSGIVTARTIGQALALPVIGVSNFDCLGLVLQDQLPAAVVLKAGTNRGIMHYFACAYERGKNGSAFVVDPCYLALEELGPTLGDIKTWFAEADLQAAVEEQGGQFQLLPHIENMAIIQGKIALGLLGVGRVAQDFSLDDRYKFSQEFSFAKVTPLYLRSPSITLKASR